MAGRGLRNPAALVVVFATFALTLPAPAFAHSELRGSSPADGDVLSVAPRVLRLSFNEVPELAVSRLTLTGPDGPIALSALRLDADSATVLVGGIEGRLVAGTYTVNWQAVGADGHPVRGEYSFTIEDGAAGLQMAEPAAPGSAPDNPDGTPASASDDPVTAQGAQGAESLGSSNVILWVIGAVVVAVLAVVGYQLFARRPLDDGDVHA